jgi:hypothetical protein
VGFCSALYKQWHVHARLATDLMERRQAFDWYMHLRYDLAFDRPFVLTDELRDPETLYVARSMFFSYPGNATGDVDNQRVDPIEWRDHKLSLRNSVADFIFAGAWTTVGPALDRYTIFVELLRQLRLHQSRPVEHILDEPELFFSHALRAMGIEFGDSDTMARVSCVFGCEHPVTYSILFVHPFIELIRDGQLLQDVFRDPPSRRM